MASTWSDVLEALRAIEEGLNNFRRWLEREASAADNPARYELWLHDVFHYDSGKFRPVEMPNGRVALFPGNESVFFFRGQRKDWGSCKAAVYRSGRGEIDLFIARLQQVEFELVLREHPAVKDVLRTALRLSLPDGRTRYYGIRLSFPGLAQHYRIPSDYLDVTCDPYVAAFFAVCRWCESEQRYFPILEQPEPGVIMKTPQPVYTWPMTSVNKLEPIGLQPFPRPTRQKALAVRLSQGEDLMAHRMFFEHNREASQAIFERFDGGEALFPPDPVREKASEIKRVPDPGETKAHSQWAFEQVLDRYGFVESEEHYVRQLLERRVVITGSSPYHFSPTEINRFRQDWEGGGRAEFYEQIGPVRLQYIPASS